MDCVIAVVYVEKRRWDHFIVRNDGVCCDICPVSEERDKNYSCGDMLSPNQIHHLPLSLNGKEIQASKYNTVKLSVKMDGHTLSYFVKVLKLLSTYRKQVLSHLNSRHNKIKSCDENSIVLLNIRLVDVGHQILDKLWNDRITYLVAEQCELDHAMSWLSTLGGAFSALGDHYIRCAEIAGHISLQQWRIALRVGDPSTVARCYLFSALSLMQTGHLRAAKRIILKQYQAVKSGKYGHEPDIRLIRMCHGIWAKLRYEYQQRRQRKKTPKAFHWKT